MNIKLIDAVVEQIGDRDSLADAARAGADEFGLSRVEFLKAFNCIDGDLMENEIGEIVYSDGDSTAVKNALAWFALEEVARHENPDA